MWIRVYNKKAELKVTYLSISILFLLFFFVLLVFAFLWRRLLKLLSVLQEQRVSQTGTKEKVARLHGHHLEEGRPEASVQA